MNSLLYCYLGSASASPGASVVSQHSIGSTCLPCLVACRLASFGARASEFVLVATLPISLFTVSLMNLLSKTDFRYVANS
jgi:hypothetical protein